MSRCRQCRPADALGATAPYREASSGGVRGGGGGVAWGWRGGGGGLGGGAGVSCGGTYTRHRYHALPNGKNTQALSFGGFAPGLSYPRRPSNRTLAGDKTGRQRGGRGGSWDRALVKWQSEDQWPKRKKVKISPYDVQLNVISMVIILRYMLWYPDPPPPNSLLACGLPSRKVGGGG